MKRRRFLTISAAMLAAATPPARAERMVWQSQAFGGTVSVDLRGPRAANADLTRRIGAIIAEVEAAANLFSPTSALSQLNDTGALRDPPRALRDLMQQADRLHRLTQGLFDPTVQPLWQALARGEDPGPAWARIGWNPHWAQGAIRLAPGQALTLNGLAQGYAADRVRAQLQAEGYAAALVDLGEYAALGGPFLLGIEDPQQGRIATRRLQDAAIATSSPGAMMLGAGGHILGPHGEAPRWSTVSVEAESAALADGLSTALCLADTALIADLAARPGLLRRVLTVSPEGDVQTWQGRAA